MSPPSIALDHVHLLSRNPVNTARWYEENLGCKVVKQVEVAGAPQIYLSIGSESLLIIRGERTGERVNGGESDKKWGTEHFGFRVASGFSQLCETLKGRGVKFLMEPKDINSATTVAFIEGPDGVEIELLDRREWPHLKNLGADPSAASRR
ncbi:MAG: VOC family protein [Pseudomonadota bacterium]